MTGVAGSEVGGALVTWVAAAATLAAWSVLVGGGRVFRWAQHLLAGLATGYLALLAIREVLMPRLVAPLLDAPLAAPGLWIVLVLGGLLVAGRWLPRGAALLPVAVLAAATAAFALGGAVVGTLLPQLAAGVVLPGAGSLVAGGLLSLAITALVAIAFIEGWRPAPIGRAAVASGRWLLLAGVGGWIGFLVVSRLALLVDRLGFLAGDWLGIGR